MTTKLTLLFACVFSSMEALAADDATSIAGRWQVDRVMTSSVERHIARIAIVTFAPLRSDGVLRGSVDAGNLHTFVFTVDGQRLHMACAEYPPCTSTLVGLRKRRVDGQPETADELAAPAKAADDDDEYLGKLFIENDAYWVAGTSGITLGFVMADTRIELSRYTAPAAPPTTP